MTQEHVDRLASTLVDAVRGLGAERGIDLVLHALFVRQVAGRAQGGDTWRLLAESDLERLGERFRTLDVFGEPPTQRPAEPEIYQAPLRNLIRVIDSEIPLGLQSEDQAALLTETFEAVLAHLSRLGRQAGEWDTPRGIATLMTRLTVRAGDLVLDPACGNGTTLLFAAKAADQVRVSGYEINPRVARRAAMRLSLHDAVASGGFGAVASDAFAEHAPDYADVVVLQPPWNARYAEADKAVIRELGKSSEGNPPVDGAPKGDMPWLFLALDALRAGGRAAVLLSGSSVSSRYRQAHEWLLQGNAIEAIISLPPGVFGHTSVPAVLWLLRRPSALPEERVLVVDAQTLTEQSGSVDGADLSREAVDLISRTVTASRAGEPLSVPGYVGRLVEVGHVDLARGLHPGLYLDQPPAEEVTHPSPARSLLTEIELRNFKAFGGRTRIPLAPLTLVYGANSAGKSSVIQALLLLKQSSGSDVLVTQGALTNVGGFQGLIHRHEQNPVELGFTYGTLHRWLPEEGTPDPTLLRHVTWTFTTNGAGQGVPRDVRINFGDFTLDYASESDGGRFLLRQDELAEVFRGVASGTLLYPFDSRYATDGSDEEQSKRLKGRESNARRARRLLERNGVSALEVPAQGLLPYGEALPPRIVGLEEREQGIVDSYVKRSARLGAGVAAEVRQLLSSVTWLGPLRSAPQRVYDRADSTSAPGDGRHVAIYLFDHATVVEQVNHWLKQLEIPYSLDVVPIGATKSSTLIGDLVAIVLTDARTGVEVTPADVGFGISQSLPIVVELLARRESIIAIEQPETHLHPRLQARLGDLLIDTTQEGGQGNQVLVETHSEHLMLRVQRRIREGTLDPAHVSVVYVDQGPDGRTTVKPLRLNEQGEFLDEWPDGFFDDRLDELFGEF